MGARRAHVVAAAPTVRNSLKGFQPGQTTTSRARLNPLPLCANSAPSCAPLRHVLSAVSSVVALALSGIWCGKQPSEAASFGTYLVVSDTTPGFSKERVSEILFPGRFDAGYT